jgi:hypothetical protein
MQHNAVILGIEIRDFSEQRTEEILKSLAWLICLINIATICEHF